MAGRAFFETDLVVWLGATLAISFLAHLPLPWAAAASSSGTLGFGPSELLWPRSCAYLVLASILLSPQRTG
eukprot:4918102-Pleurochrysis_carterae.AAC.2